jgi:hypothetical protein
MENKPESSPKLLHVLITAGTTLLVALIGLGTAIYQTNAPIRQTEAANAALTALAPTLIAQFTQTAQASAPPAQATPSLQASQATLPAKTDLPAVTSAPSTPSISISNKLYLAVKIAIDGVDKGSIDADGAKTYLLDSFPVNVTWSVEKETTAQGSPLGHDMSGTFKDAAVGDQLTIDNVVDNQPYFAPFVTNPGAVDCEVTINKGWKSEFVTHAVVSAKTDNVGFGYYQLYTNSNVTLDCGGEIYWWGLQPNDSSGTSFFNDVEKDTGIIDFTLKP